MFLPPSTQTLSFDSRDVCEMPPPNIASLSTDVSTLGIDAQFIAMLSAFRPYGGLARRRELESSLVLRTGLGHETLQRWIEAEEIFAFEWCHEEWIALFQLAHPSLQPLPDVRRIADLLRPVLQPWGIAVWFARPNSMLNGNTPISQLVDRQEVVLQAAYRTAQKGVRLLRD
jgi:hypothetical protein